MTDYSQFQFKDNIYSRPSNANNNLEDKEEWEEKLQTVVDDLMPYNKYKKIMIFSAFMTLYFLITAIVIHVLSNSITEIIIDYAHLSTRGESITYNITLHSELQPPIYLYYEIHNILQNQKDMLNSIDYDQLNGQLKSNPNCGTKSTNLQMHKFKSINGKQLNPDDIAIPCGLMAYTYFNDTYSLHYRNQTQLSNIEIRNWDLMDFETDFENVKDFKDKQWIDMENIHFRIWMKTSAITPFRKIWGIIDQKLPSGDYELKINNEYDSYSFKAQKYFILMKSNVIGYKKPVFIISHYILGSINLIIFAYSSFQLFQFWKEKHHLQ